MTRRSVRPVAVTAATRWDLEADVVVVGYGIAGVSAAIAAAAEVVHVDGEAVPGLYAAGRSASGVPVLGYASGTSLGDGSFFGRRAGAHAAGRRKEDR